MKEGIVRDILLINNDYNFDIEIERAFALKEVFVQKFLFEKMLELNDTKYSKFIM